MAAAGDGGGKSDGSSSNAACLALRIATVALSVASAVMMASASQRSCTGCSPATASQQPVSYRDYSSLRYVTRPHRTYPCIKLFFLACMNIYAA